VSTVEKSAIEHHTEGDRPAALDCWPVTEHVKVDGERQIGAEVPFLPRAKREVNSASLATDSLNP